MYVECGSGPAIEKWKANSILDPSSQIDVCETMAIMNERELEAKSIKVDNFFFYSS